MIIRTLSGLILSGGLALSAAGCVSGPTAMPTSGDTQSGMMCPKCETVWVHNLKGQGTKVQRLVSERAMVCPDCNEMAEAYFDKGQLVLHECPQCRVTPQVVKPSKPSHPKGTHEG